MAIFASLEEAFQTRNGLRIVCDETVSEPDLNKALPAARKTFDATLAAIAVRRGQATADFVAMQWNMCGDEATSEWQGLPS